MKKSLLILCTGLTIFALTAFGFINRSNPEAIDLVYHVDSRFMATITKENLHRATSVVDIVPKEADWSKIYFQNMTVAILQGDDEKRAIGDNEVLNADQTKLLQSADYSTNFYVKGSGKRKVGALNGLKVLDQEGVDYVYYLTIVPEKEAEYTAGHDALITYLKENSRAATAIISEDKLQPGRILFTITKEGTIEDIILDSTSGYPLVDQVLLKLVSTIPGKWNPATNSTGEKVDQQLVFFFGLQGC